MAKIYCIKIIFNTKEYIYNSKTLTQNVCVTETIL